MSYVIYHPGTGTFVAAEDSVLIRVEDMPLDFDEWEDYMSWSGVRTFSIEKGNELA